MNSHYDRATNTLTIAPGHYDNLHQNNSIDQVYISPNGHTIYIMPHVVNPPPYVRNFFSREVIDEDTGIKTIKYYFCLKNSFDADYIWTWENSFNKNVVYLEKFPGTRPERFTNNMNICLPIKYFERDIVNQIHLTAGKKCDEGFYIPLLTEDSNQIPTVRIVQKPTVFHSPNKSRQSEQNIEFTFTRKPINVPRPQPPPGVIPITTEQRINDIRKQPKVDGNGVYRSTDIRPATTPITLVKKNGDKQEYRVGYATQYDLVKNIQNRLQQSNLNFESINNPNIQSSARVLTPNKSDNRIASKPRDRIRDTPTPSSASKANSGISPVSFGPSFKNIGFKPNNSQSLHIEDIGDSESTEIYQFMAPESPIQPIQPVKHSAVKHSAPHMERSSLALSNGIASCSTVKPPASGLNSKIHIPPNMMPRSSSSLSSSAVKPPAKSKNNSSKTKPPAAQPVIKFKGFGFQGFNKDNDMGDIPD